MNKLNCLTFLCTLWILCLSYTVQAQQTLGIIWDPPANESKAIEELRRFHEMGFSAIELQTSPPDRIWEIIEKQDMVVYGDLNLSFSTAYTYKNADSTFSESIRKKITVFTAEPSVKAVKLFEFSAIQQADFRKEASSFFSNYNALTKTKAYFIDNRVVEQQTSLPTDFMVYDIAVSAKNRRSLNIPDSEVIGGYRYRPSEELQNMVTPLKQVMQQIADRPEKPLFLESQWLLSMVDKYPRLKETLQTLSSDSQFLFPVPHESFPSESQPPLAVIILLLTWATLGYHYNMSPLYRKSLFRYFTGHTFFVNDIFRRHIRSPIPALVILGQHALLMSAALFAVFNTLWSPLGLKCITTHFPTLFFLGDGPYIYFFFALGGILAFSIVGILWLYFSHKSLRSITQIMTLFAWPLQINFLVATVTIAIYVSGGTDYAIIFSALVMILVTGASFIIAAWDASQFLSAEKMKYLALTVGLYSMILLVVLLWIGGFSNPFWAVVDLSLQLT